MMMIRSYAKLNKCLWACMNINFFYLSYDWPIANLKNIKQTLFSMNRKINQFSEENYYISMQSKPLLEQVYAPCSFNKPRIFYKQGSILKPKNRIKCYYVEDVI